MPLYNFECTCEECQHEWEDMVKLEDLETKEVFCPKCGRLGRRLMSGPKTKHVSWSTWRMGHGQ